MAEETCTNRAIVLSDTHFGAIHDPTEDEETNITDLINLLDLIENDIKPKTIILLGDIFDLWRVTFEYAWDNANDVKFFERLTNYVNKYEKDGAELIYVLGNHDHFLQEICWAIKTKERYRKIIMGEDYKGEKTDGMIMELKEIEELKEFQGKKGLDGVKFYYPHYKKDFGGKIGLVYFDHGHYNTKEQRQSKKLLALIIKLLSRYFSKSERTLSKKVSSKEVYEDLEANLASVYSLLYYSKLDDLVRSARDYIWRTWNLRWGIFSAVLGFILPVLFTIIYPNKVDIVDFNSFKDILSSNDGRLIAYTIFSLILYKRGPNIIGIFLPRILTGTVSSMRDKSVKDVVPQIVKKDVSIEKKDYKYLNLMEDEGTGKKEINHYIFGHTHKAGKIKATVPKTDRDLNVYNCGSWVRKQHGKDTKSCTNSFIIIDPDSSSEDKITIHHMDNMGKKECKFDKKGKCKYECKK